MNKKKQPPPGDQFPEFIHEALQQNDLSAEFRVRPKQQQIKYLRWINSAQKSEIKIKRLNQMLSELRHGDKFLNLPIK